MQKCKLTLYRWGLPFLYDYQTWEPQDPDEVIDIVTKLAAESGAELGIEVSGDVLDINASEGEYAIAVHFHDDRYLELVGDPAANGTVPYVVGGQVVDFPRRYLVTPEQVLAVVKLFLATGTVDLKGRRWDSERSRSI